jgi:hypothetical protein
MALACATRPCTVISVSPGEAMPISITTSSSDCVHCGRHRRRFGLYCGTCYKPRLVRAGMPYPEGSPVDRSPGSRHHFRCFDARECPCHRPAMHYGGS